MDPLIAKLERRFSPEFSGLLAKRIINTPKHIAANTKYRDSCSDFSHNTHPINWSSTARFVNFNIDELAWMHREDIFNKP